MNKCYDKYPEIYKTKRKFQETLTSEVGVECALTFEVGTRKN